MVFEYDEIETWDALFSLWMREVVSARVMAAAAQPQEFVEDAGGIFLDAIGKDELTRFLQEKFACHSVRVFHGTRVSETVLAAIRKEGLKPLDLWSRKATLVAEWRGHPEWSMRESELDAILRKYGPGWKSGGAGRREDGGVHVCLSRSGLTKGCNHYLTHGAEVDNHIINDLFPDGSGESLLQQMRTPKLISFELSFPEAEAAANPHAFPYEHLPFLAGKFLSAWAFRQSHPAWLPAHERDDIALRVPGTVAADRLTIETLRDADLEP